MTTVFVAALLVLIVAQVAPSLAQWRRFDWLQRWQEQVGRQGGESIGLVLCIGIPVLVCAIVQLALRSHLLGLFGLAFAAIVLFLCWGPRDLERDVEAVDKAPDSERRLAAAQALRRDDGALLPLESAALVEATFLAALRRWFGVLFWFVAAGPAGALLYRLIERLAVAPEFAAQTSSAQRDALGRTLRLLDWLPSHLMALALALASNFDAVFKTWHDYHVAQGKGYFSLDLGFLDAIARASVAADVAAEEEHIQAVRDPLIALDDAMVLVRRVLVVWLTIVAIVVLAGWFA